MKNLVRLLKNKPAMAALATVIVATATRLGLDLDAELVGAILGAGALVVAALTVSERKKKPKTLPTGEVSP
jgi:hypothetical protein